MSHSRSMFSIIVGEDDEYKKKKKILEEYNKNLKPANLSI